MFYSHLFSKLLELIFLTHSILHSVILLNSEAKIFNTLFYSLINPWRACVERVTVVVSCVCLSVCLSVCPHTRYSGSTRNHRVGKLYK